MLLSLLLLAVAAWQIHQIWTMRTDELPPLLVHAARAFVTVVGAGVVILEVVTLADRIVLAIAR